MTTMIDKYFTISKYAMDLANGTVRISEGGDLCMCAFLTYKSCEYALKHIMNFKGIKYDNNLKDLSQYIDILKDAGYYPYSLQVLHSTTPIIVPWLNMGQYGDVITSNTILKETLQQIRAVVDDYLR